MAKQMSLKEIENRLKNVKKWNRSGNSLEKEFEFKDFRQAVQFINKVADVAEAENHHPNILLHDWNKVRLSLSTHAASGISQKDFSLASKIDEISLT